MRVASEDAASVLPRDHGNIAVRQMDELPRFDPRAFLLVDDRERVLEVLDGSYLRLGPGFFSGRLEILSFVF
jgi:hypothetical protein